MVKVDIITIGPIVSPGSLTSRKSATESFPISITRADRQISNDMATKSSMRRLMLRRSLLLVCLLMTSLIASTMTHARERIAVTTIECSIANHANDASDKSPDNSDKDVLHTHSGCLSHENFTSAIDAIHTRAGTIRNSFFVPAAVALARWSLDPGLRPPMA